MEKKNWAEEWVTNSGDFCFSYNVLDDYQVWESNAKIVVIHPVTGLRLMYPQDYYSKEYQVRAIEKDLLDQEQKLKQKLLKTA